MWPALSVLSVNVAPRVSLWLESEVAFAWHRLLSHFRTARMSSVGRRHEVTWKTVGIDFFWKACHMFF
jgi:hypothetical protein